MVGWPGASQDRLFASSPDTRPGSPGVPRGPRGRSRTAGAPATQCCAATPAGSGTRPPTEPCSPRWHDSCPAADRPVSAENPVHRSDQQGCSPCRPPVMIIDHVPAVRLRHEALLFRMEVRDRPSPRRRSGRVKLEAAGAGGRRGRQEQPRQSRAGSVLPDGPGPVSETGRYTRETGVVTPLEQAPALTRWIRAGMRCAPAFHDGRGTPGRVCEVWAWRPR